MIHAKGVTAMGGYGSSRWSYASKRTTVEDCLFLSTARLTRLRLLMADFHYSGSLNWSNTRTGEKTSTIGYDAETGPDGGSVRLHYTRTKAGDDVDYRVTLTTTPLPWGGLRWWFICPLIRNGHACRRRCGKLYLPPGGRWFGCRRCYDLTYTTCQESHKFDRILDTIGREYGVSGREAAKLIREGLL